MLRCDTRRTSGATKVAALPSRVGGRVVVGEEGRRGRPRTPSKRQLAKVVARFGPFPDLLEEFEQLGMAARGVIDHFTLESVAEGAEIEAIGVVEHEGRRVLQVFGLGWRAQ